MLFQSFSNSSTRSSPALNVSVSKPVIRSFCLVCGRVPKQPTLSHYYDVNSAPIPMSRDEDPEAGFMSISKKLRDILQVSETQRNQLVPSNEICKKCFKQVVDIDFMQNQVRNKHIPYIRTY